MVFNSPTTLIALFIILWLCVLTIVVQRMVSHYNKLTRGVSKIGLKEVLETLISDQRMTKARQLEFEREIAQIDKRIKTHVQKIGIVRYNPFGDTGGSQSFSLVLLDEHNNGIVMTSLYARTGNRWYVKEIREGKGSELELSKEENTAVKRAQVLTIKHHE